MGGLDLAVIVVNWNVRDLLLGCLEAVRAAVASAGLRARTLVVDNASRDGSAEAVRERFDDVLLLASPVNLGFAGGNNLGLRVAGFDQVPIDPSVSHLVSEDVISTAGRPRYVLFVNPDTVVRESAVGEMVRFMERQPRVGVCGPRLFYGDGSFQHAAYRFPSLAQAFLDFWPINWRLTASRLNGRYPRRLYEAGEPFPIDHPLGATMLFRDAVIADTGGFDLGYHMYVEEIDWCIRTRRAGWEVYCVPRAEVVHYHGQSTRQVRPQMRAALWRSRYRLFQKHYSPLYRWAVRRIVRAGMRVEIRRTAKAAGRGEIDGAAAAAMMDACRQVMAM